MTFIDSAGTVLNKTELLALATVQSAESIYKFNADVYEKITYDGGDTFEGGQKLLFHSGQYVRAGDIDGIFLTGTVTSISPNTGPAAGGTVVTIDGTNLAGSEGVTFGGTAGTAFQRISNTRVRVTTPAKTAGAYTVVVKDDAGDITTLTGFTYS